MQFDLIDLDLFARIADAGSITHGARRAHLALPSASARIGNMERMLGAELLHRNRRGVTLTPAGTLLLRHARTVLHEIDRMRGDLAQYVDGLGATVRLLANTAATATFLPSELIAFLADQPAINIELEERPSHQIVQAIAEGRADLGIVADTVSLGRLEQITIRTDRLVVVTPSAHPLARHAEATFSDCLDEPFVGLPEGSALQEHLEGHAQPLGQRPRYRIRLPSIELVCQHVSAGIGISVLPQTAVDRWQTLHPVTTIALTDWWADRRLTLCHADATQLSAPAQRLVGHLTRSQATTDC